MKIINFKLNLSKVILVFIILLIAILVPVYCLGYKNDKTIELTNENYTLILKDAHENISKYVGKKIKMTGYVFRVDDFTEEQFVTARDMLINKTESQVVGFLCSSKEIKNYENNVWIEVSGIITRGFYNGEMPLVEVTEIKKVNTPNDIFVRQEGRTLCLKSFQNLLFLKSYLLLLLLL